MAFYASKGLLRAAGLSRSFEDKLDRDLMIAKRAVPSYVPPRMRYYSMPGGIAMGTAKIELGTEIQYPSDDVLCQYEFGRQKWRCVPVPATLMFLVQRTDEGDHEGEIWGWFKNARWDYIADAPPNDAKPFLVELEEETWDLLPGKHVFALANGYTGVELNPTATLYRLIPGARSNTWELVDTWSWAYSDSYYQMQDEYPWEDTGRETEPDWDADRTREYDPAVYIPGIGIVFAWHCFYWAWWSTPPYYTAYPQSCFLVWNGVGNNELTDREHYYQEGPMPCHWPLNMFLAGNYSYPDHCTGVDNYDAGGWQPHGSYPSVIIGGCTRDPTYNHWDETDAQLAGASQFAFTEIILDCWDHDFDVHNSVIYNAIAQEWYKVLKFSVIDEYTAEWLNQWQFVDCRADVNPSNCYRCVRYETSIVGPANEAGDYEFYYVKLIEDGTIWKMPVDIAGNINVYGRTQEQCEQITTAPPFGNEWRHCLQVADNNIYLDEES